MLSARFSATEPSAVDNSAGCGQLGGQEAAALAGEVDLLEAEPLDAEPPLDEEPPLDAELPLDEEPESVFEPLSDFEPESDFAPAGTELSAFAEAAFRLSVR